MNTLGSRIISLRQELDYTQTELAEKINVTKSMLSKYENDLNMPKGDILLSIAIQLNTSVDYLLGKTEIKLPYPNQINLITLNNIEKDLIKNFRDLSKVNQIRIIERIDCLKENDKFSDKNYKTQ